MPSIETPDYTGLPYIDCVCGRCTIGDDAGHDDAALSACLHGVQDLFTSIERGLDPGHEGARIAFGTARELLAHCRVLLCLLRQEVRGNVPEPAGPH